MRRIIPVVAVLVCFTLVARGQSPETKKEFSPENSLELQVGYNNGLGVFGHFVTAHFAEDFPMELRAGMGYTSMDPGAPYQARKIFINNNTSGTPEKRGHALDFQLDFMYNVRVFQIKRTMLYGGVRHSRFLGNFNFIGGNEDFDITHRTWGLGTGIEALFPMTSNLDFLMDAGFSYLFPNTMEGHSTAYNPDGEHIEPRENYTYKDADEAINQPKFQFRITLGTRFNL